MIADIRPSPIAGKWYDNQPEALASEIDFYLDNANQPDLNGDIIAVIAPHAGYRYSGAVAGHAFAPLSNRTPNLVAVISPMHYPYDPPLITSSHKFYATPLGDIPIDRDTINQLDSILQTDSGIGLASIARDQEHSLEIELPFLQRTLKSDFKLLPIMIRSQEPHIAKALGNALAKVLNGTDFALVASTDLSHFYDLETAEKLDGEMLRQIESFSPEGVFEAELNGTGFACGHAAVAAVLWASRALGADSVKILHYATSGEITGDNSSVVGYGAATVLKSNP